MKNSAALSNAPIWDISVYADEIFSPDVGIEPALALLQRFGVGNTVLRVVDGRHSIMVLTNDELTALASLLRKYGIKVAAIETPIFKCPLRENNFINWGNCQGFADNLTFDEHLALLTRSFEVADRMGTREIRCFSFWREFELDDVFEEVVEKLGVAARRAETAGFKLFVQNEQDTLAATGVELARILKAVGSPNLVAAYDLGNSARQGGVPFPDDYRALRGHLEHVQVRFQAIDIRCGFVHPDADQTAPKGPNFAYTFWCQPGQPISGWIQIGEKRFDIVGPRTFLRLDETVGVDYRSFFKELKKDGYDGRISVDPNYFIPGAAEGTPSEIEANFKLTIASLRELIVEVWA